MSNEREPYNCSICGQPIVPDFVSGPRCQCKEKRAVVTGSPGNSIEERQQRDRDAELQARAAYDRASQQEPLEATINTFGHKISVTGYDPKTFKSDPVTGLAPGTTELRINNDLSWKFIKPRPMREEPELIEDISTSQEDHVVHEPTKDFDLKRLDLVDNRPRYVRENAASFLALEQALSLVCNCGGAPTCKKDDDEHKRYRRCMKIEQDYCPRVEFDQALNALVDLPPLKGCNVIHEQDGDTFECGAEPVCVTQWFQAQCDRHAGIYSNNPVSSVFGELSPEAEQRLYPKV